VVGIHLVNRFDVSTGDANYFLLLLFTVFIEIFLLGNNIRKALVWI
jgi:hypothetical protein